MGAAANNNNITGTVTNEVVAHGGKPRTPGIGDTLADVGSGLKEQFKAATDIGAQVNSVKETVAGVPVAPGYSISDFGKDLGSMSTDGLTNALSQVTGINLANIVQIPSAAAVKQYLSSFLDGLQAEIINEINNCIQNYLAELLNKIPALALLFNYDKVIARLIAEQRMKLQRMIQGELEKLMFQKLQVQQIALFKQKMVGAIRGVCGGSSNTFTKRLQGDSSYQQKAAQETAAGITQDMTADIASQAAGADITSGDDIIDI